MSRDTNSNSSTEASTSPDRAAASRTNGAKSHGPVTPEGKKISSGNSYKHGLFASVENLTCHEDPTEFKSLHQGIYEEYLPKSAMELHYVETVVACTWRLKRADTIEAQLLNSDDSEPAYNFNRYTDKLTALEKIRASIEKRLKNAKAELDKMQSDTQPTEREIEFRKNNTPEIAQEVVNEKIEDQYRERQEAEEAEQALWKARQDAIRRQKAADALPVTLVEEGRKRYELNAEQMNWLYDQLERPDAPAGMDIIKQL